MHVQFRDNMPRWKTQRIAMTVTGKHFVLASADLQRVVNAHAERQGLQSRGDPYQGLLESPSHEQVLQHIKNRIFSLEHGLGQPPDSAALSSSSSDQLLLATSLKLQKESSFNAESSSNPSPDHTDSSAVDGAGFTPSDATLVTQVEWLAWGREYGACFPHRACKCRTRRSESEIISINSDLTKADIKLSSPNHQSALLLRPDEARRIVHFHFDNILWHHNAFHSPTFLEQCENFWLYGVCDHPLWMSLYLSVISTSLWCALNSPRLLDIGIEINENLVRSLFGEMVDVLYKENFLKNLSIYSVQAIVISTRIAHNLDMSDLNATLVGAAIRIAHCMGLHKISDAPLAGVEVGNDSLGNNAWYEAIERETGKRAWWQLVIQDNFSTPFTDTYLINPSHFSTTLPSNCNDDLVERGPDIPTISSYVRTLAQVALLIPPLLDGLGPMSKRRPIQEQYEHILRMDQRMRTYVRSISPVLLRHDGNDEQAQPAWLPVARRSLALTAADKIIMIHRPILFYSFHDKAYSYTRATCVAAALTILREYERIEIEDHISIWTHTAFCVTAAAVLGLELLYRREHIDEQANHYRGSIVKARERLLARRGDLLAIRGANLIQTILGTEEEVVLRAMRGVTNTQSQPFSLENQSIDFNRFMVKFLALETPSLTMTGGEALYPPVFENSEPLLTEDFNQWFNHVF